MRWPTGKQFGKSRDDVPITEVIIPNCNEKHYGNLNYMQTMQIGKSDIILCSPVSFLMSSNNELSSNGIVVEARTSILCTACLFSQSTLTSTIQLSNIR